METLRAWQRAIRDRVAAWDRTRKIVNLAVIPALVALALVLPPISAVERVLAAGYTAIGPEGGSVVDPDGARLTVLAEGLTSGGTRVRMSSIPRADFLEGRAAGFEAAGGSLPEWLQPKSPLYTLSSFGPAPSAVVLTIPIPNDAEPVYTLDLYAWEGGGWRWLPRTVIPEEDLLETRLDHLPDAVLVVQSAPLAPSVGVQWLDGDELDPEELVGLAWVESVGLFVENDGVSGEATVASDPSLLAALSLPEGPRILPVLVNWRGGEVRGDLINNILVRPDLLQRHVEEVLGLVVDGGYAGLQINYRGVPLELATEFSTFVAALAEGLGAEEKILGVRVEPARQVADDRWETGGYDWQALGGAVDRFVLPAAGADAAPGGLEGLLSFAVGQVDRYKIQLELSAFAGDQVGGESSAISYEEALALLGGEISLSDDLISPGEEVLAELSSPGLSSLGFDDQLLAFRFYYQDLLGDHTVTVRNGETAGLRLAQAQAFNLGGATVFGLLSPGNDPRIWESLYAYRDAAPIRTESEFAVVWQVQNAAGLLIRTDLAEPSDPAFSWGTALGGEYLISYFISDDGGQTPLVGGEAVALLVATPTPVPTPTPTPRPQTTAPVVQAPAPPGTGFDYGVQVHPYQQNLGQLVGSIQGMGFRWVKVQVRWDWIEPAPGQRNWNAFGLEEGVNALSGAGLKILFSVVAAPAWSRTVTEEAGPPDDYNLFANFVRDLAVHFGGRIHAIEVMNETNLQREWHTGRPLSASEYVDLLCRSYRSIKEVAPGLVVVSGAPTPTGWNDGIIAIDDAIYLEQMYQAGLRGCSDAIGVHPSGYNNPPDAQWETWSLDPSHTFNATGHRSWFFLSTIQQYHNIMCKYGDCNKRLWATEFGWASIEGIAGAAIPGWDFAQDNTEAEQADYLVRSYQIGKTSGYMGVMFLWNLNYAPVCGAGCEQSMYGIARPDWSLRPAYHALANMPK